MSLLRAIIQNTSTHILFVYSSELTFYLEHLLSPLDVQENVGEGPDGVRVPPHHHVGKSRINKNNVMVRGYLDMSDC